jgi:phosphoribosylformylglycinamidine synthase
MTGDRLLELLASPEIASKRIVWRQYDHQVGTNTVIGPGSDAAVIRIKGTNKALAIATDGNAAYTYLDPYTGGAIAVAEAARNVACSGAKPIAMTNCLNFGNPEKTEVYYQLKEAIRGMSDAARALGVPVISGNVSLYNETNGEAIWPTPVVGVVGLIDDVERVVPMGFQQPGDTIMLAIQVPLGGGVFHESAYLSGELAGSVHARHEALLAGQPRLHLDGERRLQAFLRECATLGVLRSAHDVSAGGAMVAMAEACIQKGIGARITGFRVSRTDASLFGEGQSRILLSCEPQHEDEIARAAQRYQCAVLDIGLVGGTRLRAPLVDLPVSALREAYEAGLSDWSSPTGPQSWKSFSSNEAWQRYAGETANDAIARMTAEANKLGLSTTEP